MSTAITHVQPGSIAQRLGLVAGDKLVSIAGEPIIDQIDYQALTAQERFDMMVEDAGGQTRTVHVRKEDWEPLGLTLDQTIVSKPRPCRNHCIICFIDQMPPGMRKTLYVKDDDWRLSLMMGNYITMTNIDDHELDRIIRRKVSPLFVSVQCTDPDMRVKLLRNPNAAKIMDNLRLLKANGIRHVSLMPMMMVAGDHANNDMAGAEPDSHKSILEAAGYTADAYIHGIAETPPIQSVFLELANHESNSL